MLVESNTRAPVLLYLLNLLRKSDKMLGKPCILYLFPTYLIHSIKDEHLSKILYIFVESIGSLHVIYVHFTYRISEQRNARGVSPDRAFTAGIHKVLGVS